MITVQSEELLSELSFESDEVVVLEDYELEVIGGGFGNFAFR